MYTDHFGFSTLPFENVPDPNFFFDEGDHARVHKRIRDSLHAGRGLIVVSGPIGSGKTTLSQLIISEFSGDIKLIWMAQPPAGSMELFMFIAQELGLKPSVTERTFVLRDIRDALLKISSEGGKCLVIMDESHLMTDDVIDGIRLLNNLEEGPAKLVNMLLLGQEEMLETIKRPEFEPFRQRIATLEILGKMDPERIRSYVSHRIHVAGGGSSVFSDTGLEAVSLAFGPEGTPRLINLLCDRSLSTAYERGKSAADVDDVYHAAEGMGMSKEVFHYRMKLRDMDRNKHPQAGEENRTEGETPPEIQDKTNLDTIIRKKEDKKGIKVPLIMLLLSVAALAASILFYCRESGSGDAASCLLDMMGL